MKLHHPQPLHWLSTKGRDGSREKEKKLVFALNQPSKERKDCHNEQRDRARRAAQTAEQRQLSLQQRHHLHEDQAAADEGSQHMQQRAD